MDRSHLTVVHVKWIDSCVLGEWADLEDLEHGFDVIDTVGFLVHEDQEALFISSTYDGSRDSVIAAMWIPRASVRSVQTIGKVAIK